MCASDSTSDRFKDQIRVLDMNKEFTNSVEKGGKFIDLYWRNSVSDSASDRFIFELVVIIFAKKTAEMDNHLVLS